MFTFSLNTTVTNDKPNFDTERISSISGKPFIATSIGKVMVRSTSTGARVGDDVRICTCMFVTSGTASIGNCLNAAIPAAIRIITAKITSSLCFSEKWIILSIILFHLP